MSECGGWRPKGDGMEGTIGAPGAFFCHVVRFSSSNLPVITSNTMFIFSHLTS